MIREGVKTAIVGKPNAGKSSLLNFLLGEERAIVTEVEGTTRDILTETVQMGGITLNVADTAGIRDTQDQVEKIGVERARKNALEADLIIYVTDSSRKLDENDRAIMEMLQGKKVIILLDEYDTPLQESYIHGYWENLTAFIRSLFNSTFKTNPIWNGDC